MSTFDTSKLPLSVHVEYVLDGRKVPASELVGATGEDFAERCVAQGLAHVLADDVLVLDPEPARRAPHEQLLDRPRT